MDSVIGKDKTRLKINIPVGGRKKQQKSLKMALTAKAHFGILIKLSSDSKKN